VARGRLGDGRLEDVRVIYRQQPKVRGSKHFGSRLVFARDGTLFVTQGERFDYAEQAQGFCRFCQFSRHKDQRRLAS
jgi:glucose/arabinose dehydrogenase